MKNTKPEFHFFIWFSINMYWVQLSTDLWFPHPLKVKNFITGFGQSLILGWERYLTALCLSVSKYKTMTISTTGITGLMHIKCLAYGQLTYNKHPTGSS